MAAGIFQYPLRGSKLRSAKVSPTHKMPRSYLQAVASNRPERQDLLEPAEWPTYQQNLVDGFITASLARAGSSAAGTAQSALKAHLVPWLSQREKYVWEATFA